MKVVQNIYRQNAFSDKGQNVLIHPISLSVYNKKKRRKLYWILVTIVLLLNVIALGIYIVVFKK
ncbi:hypothetical protein NO995_02740 [Aestuariibaculum sp. M13]|uniref:hypothetical protein n=1 Tax=Aestuariibaculum sp. M13 TaxID=2967132 RepID=UPI00215A03DF|nr:hypothetical protein [Aestuariibaculum sp. M13]MCR8666583.1 hypothetical protein [Aestuariibaculum sp. M13]